jgi:hypothetical protein
MSDQTLSEFVLGYAEEMQESVKVAGHYVSDETQEAIEQAVQALLEGRESLQQDDLTAMESALRQLDSGLLRREFDREYTVQSLRNIPRFVDRTLKLSTLVASKKMPSQRLQGYLQQATRCYVFGLAAASVALSRAAVEYVLRERVAGITGPSSHKFWEMIEGGRRFGILDDAKSHLATQVKLIGNKVLHGGIVSDDEALEALLAARALLEELHS